MLIRNARIEGYSGPVDLRLMHGAVQEIGVGLVKGLYESELDLAGDQLRPCPPEFPLPRRYRRSREGEDCIRPGSREPFTRWRDGEMVDFIHGRSAE